jgi:putative Mg2+ transporter-C (MgtC) family protein
MLSSSDLELVGKAALAALLGFVIGWERERHGHAAGTRTLALVTTGSAALTGLALVTLPGGPGPVIQGIVQGIGFLGAGLILHARRAGVQGLTTAAAVWTVASVGVVIGAGHYAAAVLLTGVLLLILWWPYLPILSRLQPSNTRAALLRDAAKGSEERAGS